MIYREWVRWGSLESAHILNLENGCVGGVSQCNLVVTIMQWFYNFEDKNRNSPAVDTYNGRRLHPSSHRPQDFDRPAFCFWTQCNILFGSNLKIISTSLEGIKPIVISPLKKFPSTWNQSQRPVLCSLHFSNPESNIFRIKMLNVARTNPKTAGTTNNSESLAASFSVCQMIFLTSDFWCIMK
ncbi:hypothetical protein SLEP1_g33513 [Rubroshorea leprosula]|uniref:Uncharacterized protein n=1 Tax=Rubroshorea leprosula TaxID=152421 RepID=A0AAV5KGT0_9ROSI|nr:hypothetical protein SLEP1_g33513 [Rubroshorea leprosula]